MAQDDRKMERFLVEEGVDGERLDRALSIFMPGISRSQIQNIIASEGVLVNGSPCFSKKHPVREGDILEFAVPEGKELKVEPENIPLDIVFEDEDVLVVNKPKGLEISAPYFGSTLQLAHFRTPAQTRAIKRLAATWALFYDEYVTIFMVAYSSFLSNGNN